MSRKKWRISLKQMTLNVNYFLGFISTFKIISSNLGRTVWVRNAYPRVCYLKTWFSLIWRHCLGNLKRYSNIEKRMPSEISLVFKALTISSLPCLLCACVWRHECSASCSALHHSLPPHILSMMNGLLSRWNSKCK